MGNPSWKRVIVNETSTLKTNHTWNLVEQKNNQNVIASKSIYKLKGDEKGSIFQHKARLAINGLRQRNDIDFL